MSEPAVDKSAGARLEHSGIERDLALFNAYRFLSTSYLFVPIFLLFLAGRGLSFTEITLLNTVYSGTLILFEVPTGVLADRWGRKRAMVLGSLMMAGGCLLDYVGHSFLLFAAGEGLLALGMTLSSGADSAYLFDLLRDAGRESEYRRREGAASAAKLVGAALALAAGGWLARTSLSATYLVTAGVCVVASVAAALLRESRARTGFGKGVTQQIVHSARTVITHKPLAFAVLFSTLVFVLVRTSSLYVQQPYLTSAGFGVASVGVVMAGLSIVAAWGAHRIDGLRKLFGERGLLWGVPATLALSYLVLGRWTATWGVSLLLVQSLLNGVYSPLSKELLNREIVDSSQRATVLSVESAVRRLAFGMFAPLAGVLVDGYGWRAGLWCTAALGGVGTIALTVWLLRRPPVATAVYLTPANPGPSPVHDIDSGRLAAEVQRG